MKYFSTKLNRMFDTVKELEAAERSYDEKQKEAEKAKAERAAMAKKVEDAYQLAEATKKAADDLLAEFCKKYGSYHTTVTKPADTDTIFTILNKFPFWFNW